MPQCEIVIENIHVQPQLTIFIVPSHCVFFFFFQANADLLAHEVSCIVYEMAGGVGDAPKPL